MGEKEDREKAEKVAAARKRVEQMKKKKKATAGPTKTKDTTDAAVLESEGGSAARSETGVIPNLDGAGSEVDGSGLATQQNNEIEDEDTALFNQAIESATASGFDIEASEQTVSADQGESRRYTARQPSVSLQSKARSTSFRNGETPSSPDTELQDTYRKQLVRIEELEKENRMLVEEARSGDARWRKQEEELEELRERHIEQKRVDKDSQIQSLQSEISALRRRSSVSSGARTTDEANLGLRRDLATRDSTISDLQLEVSRLHAQVAAQSAGDHDEQLSALQSALSTANSTITKLQSELSDTRKAVGRAAEKAVLDSTSFTSKETRIRELERDMEAMTVEKSSADRKSQSLEKKIETLTKLHREAEQRSAPKLAAADTLQKEVQTLRTKLENSEKQLLQLREKHKRSMSGDGADELADLEDDVTAGLRAKVQELEAENSDLRRGLWRDQRRALQPSLGDEDEFSDVDLSSAPKQQHSGFTQVLNSGLSAFLGPAQRARNDSLLSDLDEFDEATFAAAAREEELKKMVEHVREVKKNLDRWKGYRLDLVESRRAVTGGQFGEIFDA